MTKQPHTEPGSGPNAKSGAGGPAIPGEAGNGGPATPGGSAADQILGAWVRLEGALRSALPVCSVQPPTQPTELLSALRINHRIGPEEEARILALREIRNRVAHALEDPPAQEADRFEEEVKDLLKGLEGKTTNPC